MKRSACMLLAILLLLAGCANAQNGIVEAKALTVTDMTGTEIRLDAPAERIVALTAANCEILYALGAGDRLIGRGTYCNYPPEALGVPEVESGGNTNIEQIVALKPQVVVLSTMAQTKEQVAALNAAGIQVLSSDAKSIDDVYKDIELMGALVGKNDEASQLVSNMKTVFDDLKQKAQSGSGKTIYFEISPLEYGLWTAGKGTFMDEIATLLGLTNAFGEVESWAEISEEQVIRRDPDYIVTSTMYEANGPSPLDEIKQRKGWEHMKAIQNENIMLTDSDEITRPGPRLTKAAKSLYDFVYGDS